MKLLLIYPPLRGLADRIPPFGCLTIAQAAAQEDCQAVILNLDRERLGFEEALDRILVEAPDLIGISAVTSTTYRFVKDVALGLKRRGVRAPIVVGGNITATSEILLRRCGVDICVIGEGYQTIRELLRLLRSRGSFDDAGLRDIKGIAYRGPDGALCFTGRRELLRLDEIPLVRNYSLIDEEYYIPRISDMGLVVHDRQKARVEKLPQDARHIDLIVGSGCQNACSFCHRNVHGVRQRPIPAVFDYIDYLMSAYNVRLFYFCDESFFVSQAWIEGFLQEVRKRDIVFRFGGVRADQVVKHEKLLVDLVAAGLIDVNVGLESGSERQLAIMDKHVSAETNQAAVRILNELGVSHVPQIIIGMPGEDARSLGETSALIARVRSAKGEASINIAQVLPGTPVYWYATHSALITDEEGYLLRVADRNASEISGTVNVSAIPLPALDLARVRMQIRSYAANKRYRAMALGVLRYLFKTVRRQLDGSLAGAGDRLYFLLYSLSGFMPAVPAGKAVRGSLRKLMVDSLKGGGLLSSLDKIKFGLLPGAEYERIPDGRLRGERE